MGRISSNDQLGRGKAKKHTVWRPPDYVYDCGVLLEGGEVLDLSPTVDLREPGGGAVASLGQLARPSNWRLDMRPRSNLPHLVEQFRARLRSAQTSLNPPDRNLSRSSAPSQWSAPTYPDRIVASCSSQPPDDFLLLLPDWLDLHPSPIRLCPGPCYDEPLLGVGVDSLAVLLGHDRVEVGREDGPRE